MIGQTNLIDILYLMDSVKFPKFIVLVGDKGSGKTTLSQIIAKEILKADFALCGIKVDEVREIINTAYTVRDKVVYCIQNADTMRNEAKNAMLKITEEPPANAYFIMTVQDSGSLLDTIKSRAFVMYMEPYTFNELKTYFWQNHSEGGEEVDTICEIATTPYEVDKLVEYGKDFIDYVQLVLDNIYDVHPANAFKSSEKLALKKDEGYDLRLFWKTFIYICLRTLESRGRGNGKTLLCKFIDVTCIVLNKVGRLGVNKQQLYDYWVFMIRSV